MQTIPCGPRCDLKEALSWHRQDTQRYMQPKVQYVANSIPSKRTFNARLQNAKIYAPENKDASKLESAAASNERVGEKMFKFDNSVVLAGSKQDFGIQPPKELSRNEGLLQNLKRYGASGILSYGLLSTVYYVGAFLFVWFYVAPTPGGMGYPAAAQRLLKILAMVWAGSQVTKSFRAGGALALAPSVDKGLSWVTIQFRFRSRGMAFGAIVVTCVALSLSVVSVVMLVWA